MSNEYDYDNYEPPNENNTKIQIAIQDSSGIITSNPSFTVSEIKANDIIYGWSFNFTDGGFAENYLKCIVMLLKNVPYNGHIRKGIWLPNYTGSPKNGYACKIEYTCIKKLEKVYIPDLGNSLPNGGTTGQVLKKSSDNDYALTWGSITGLLPTGGTSGQILKKSGNADYAVEWGDINGALPSGGTTGQVLKKSSATDYAVTWGSPDGILPTGGTDGQVLLKNGASNYAAKWGSITGVLPTGGTSGQVLKKSSTTNYACTWGDVDGTLPSGGTDGQVLLKNGSTNYAAKWGTVSAAELKSGYNSLELKTKTLTPSSNGFEIGTSSYPVTVRGDEIVLYYSSYRYCTLACNSSGKLTVNGTAIN